MNRKRRRGKRPSSLIVKDRNTADAAHEEPAPAPETAIPSDEEIANAEPILLTIVLKNGYEYKVRLKHASANIIDNKIDALNLTCVLDERQLMYIQMSEVALMFYEPINRAPSEKTRIGSEPIDLLGDDQGELPVVLHKNGRPVATAKEGKQ